MVRTTDQGISPLDDLKHLYLHVAQCLHRPVSSRIGLCPFISQVIDFRDLWIYFIHSIYCPAAIFIPVTILHNRRESLRNLVKFSQQILVLCCMYARGDSRRSNLSKFQATVNNHIYWRMRKSNLFFNIIHKQSSRMWILVNNPFNYLKKSPLFGVQSGDYLLFPLLHHQFQLTISEPLNKIQYHPHELLLAPSGWQWGLNPRVLTICM